MAVKKRINKKKKTPEPMPNLIFQNIQTDTPASEKISAKPVFKSRSDSTARGAKFLLWVGVGIFSLTIFVLWGWAMKIRLDSFSWQQTPENKIVETAKTDWDKYFTDTKTLEENKDKIKNALSQIMANITVTTTINTSTTVTSTSTTSTSTP